MKIDIMQIIELYPIIEHMELMVWVNVYQSDFLCQLQNNHTIFITDHHFQDFYIV